METTTSPSKFSGRSEMRLIKRFKFSGRIEPDSLVHSIKEEAPEGSLIAPGYVTTPWGTVPQYAATIIGVANGYNPAGDCNGYFMSSKYQPNNNCYAYGCCITPNTFPQPGRCSGGTPFSQSFTAEVVMNNAVGDGLVSVGTSIDDIKKHAAQGAAGHYVALMFSAPESNIGGDPNANWPGDYHWARCDDPINFQSWSQKDGNDQVTNFDFAGNAITNPATANWTVNQGPIGTVGTSNDSNEYTAVYAFYCYMFVPNNGVNII